MYAPIVLFVYNRPDHTRKTLQALALNPEAKDSLIYIYSDGPKNESALPLVEEVRAICREALGFRGVHLTCSALNKGLAASIVEGVSEVVERHGRVIVMEDDLLTSPYFLSFMNAALEKYENDERVMHISGATYPVNTSGIDENFFLQIPLCWGWATWARAWCHFRKDISVMERFTEPMKRHFNFDDSHDFWGQLERNKKGQINTWFIFWYATLVLRGGLALFSKMSLVNNIGFDGSGIHCGTSKTYTGEIDAARPALLASIPIVECRSAFRRHAQFFNYISHSRKKRFLERIRRTIFSLIGRP